METFNNIEEQLNSYKNALNIKNTMFGNTFHLHYHVLDHLINSLQKENITYVEIGVYNGGSMCFVMQNKKVKKIIGIDPILFPGQEENIGSNINKFNINNINTKILKKYSNDKTILDELKLLGGIDVLFIDGDHSFNGVISDFEIYYKYMNPSGYIVFDDYQDYSHCPQVKPAVNFIVNNIKNKKYIDKEFEIIGSLNNYCPEIISERDNLNNEFILKIK